jgi:hypothetical protein
MSDELEQDKDREIRFFFFQNTEHGRRRRTEHFPSHFRSGEFRDTIKYENV